MDRTKLRYYGGDRIDQIIDIFSDTINVGAPSLSDGFKQVIDVKPHGFGDSAYFQGRFTTDNGATWNDFGSMTPIFSGSFPTFSTADCNAYIDENNVNIKAVSWYDYSNFVGRSYTFQYELFAIAKNTMDKPITPSPTNQRYSLLTKYNYEKIYDADTVPISVAMGSSGSVSVPHTLNKFPRVRAWFFNSASPKVCRPLLPDNTQQEYSPIETRIGSNAITFRVDATDFSPGISGNIEYRIYYD